MKCNWWVLFRYSICRSILDLFAIKLESC